MDSGFDGTDRIIDGQKKVDNSDIYRKLDHAEVAKPVLEVKGFKDIPEEKRLEIGLKFNIEAEKFKGRANNEVHLADQHNIEAKKLQDIGNGLIGEGWKAHQSSALEQVLRWRADVGRKLNGLGAGVALSKAADEGMKANDETDAKRQQLLAEQAEWTAMAILLGAKA